MGGTSDTPWQGLLEINITLFKEKSVREEIREYYPTTVLWWVSSGGIRVP
jgi:hypothetical protein